MSREVRDIIVDTVAQGVEDLLDWDDDSECHYVANRVAFAYKLTERIARDLRDAAKTYPGILEPLLHDD